MHLLELTDTHSVERCDDRGPGFAGNWILYRWRPSELRRSGMYLPITQPLSAMSMRELLEKLELGQQALQRFLDAT